MIKKKKKTTDVWYHPQEILTQHEVYLGKWTFMSSPIYFMDTHNL